MSYVGFSYVGSQASPSPSYHQSFHTEGRSQWAEGQHDLSQSCLESLPILSNQNTLRLRDPKGHERSRGLEDHVVMQRSL